MNYAEDQTKPFIDETIKSHTTIESTNGKVEMDAPLHEEEDLKPKRYAKIHDFCLGIPFGKSKSQRCKHARMHAPKYVHKEGMQYHIYV